MSDATSDAYSLATEGFGTFVDRGDPAAVDFTEADLSLVTAWRDLSLSAIVPAGAKAVVIATTITDNLVGSRIKLRKNGNTNAINVAQLKTQVANNANNADKIVACDNDRKIEYDVTVGTDDLNLTIAGWFI